MRFLVFLKKEFLLLSRDLHALLLLFLMPTLFILIMSLAMQDTFNNHTDIDISYVVKDDDNGEHSMWLSSQLEKNLNFTRYSPKSEPSTDQGSFFKDLLRSDKVKFLLRIPEGFSDAVNDDPSTVPTLIIQSSPSTQKPIVLLFESWVRENVGELFIRAAEEAEVIDVGILDTALIRSAVKSVASVEDPTMLIPTSVQQNVPAWLVFAMFFIAIPISTTLLAERSQGTMDRLNTMSISKTQFLVSKLIAYISINMVQVVLMFLVGIWVVPLLGGDPLTLGNSPAGLLLISLATSFTAVSFALVIANLANTTEQATIFAGVSNILLAAIGGVMVPRFIMPAMMQEFSLLSPHAWGLEGFLDIILRNGSVADVLPEVTCLLIFGGVMLLLSIRMMSRH